MSTWVLVLVLLWLFFGNRLVGILYPWYLLVNVVLHYGYFLEQKWFMCTKSTWLLAVVVTSVTGSTVFRLLYTEFVPQAPHALLQWHIMFHKSPLSVIQTHALYNVEIPNNIMTMSLSLPFYRKIKIYHITWVIDLFIFLFSDNVWINSSQTFHYNNFHPKSLSSFEWLNLSQFRSQIES
jgi:hypothetical protein